MSYPGQNPQQPHVPYVAGPSQPTPPQSPGPPPYYPPPAQYPPPPPAKRSRSTAATLAIIFGVLAAICVAGVVAVALIGGNKVSNDGGSTGSQPGAGNKGVAAAGSSVRDGKFEFKVVKMECGVPKVGDDVLGKTAQGQFCLVTVQVKNVGTEARTFDSSNQRAYDAAGARYDSDGTASLYANPNDEAFINGINPGNQVTAVIVFDVPKTVKLATVEWHDSAFSGGAKVAVG